MSDLNVEFEGNLGADATAGITKSGIPFTNFRVGVTPRKKDGENWVDGETKWVSVTAWRYLAERASSLAKGQRVVVKGVLSLSEYEKDGEKRHNLTADADTITLSLPFVKGEGSAKAPASAAASTESETAIF